MSAYRNSTDMPDVHSHELTKFGCTQRELHDCTPVTLLRMFFTSQHALAAIHKLIEPVGQGPMRIKQLALPAHCTSRPLEVSTF